MEDLGACRDSFPVNVFSGRGGLYKENKMSSSVPLQPKHNIWCQMESSLDNDEHAVCKLHSGEQWILE